MLAKNKSHYIDAIVRREDGTLPPVPFPNAHNLPDELVEIGSEAYIARYGLTGRHGGNHMLPHTGGKAAPRPPALAEGEANH
jgi:hypothetical protein